MTWKIGDLVALNPMEARGATAMFCGAVSKDVTLDAYYVPGEKTIVFRAVQRDGVKRERFSLPAGGILIGRYTKGASATAFVEDLDSLLAQLAQEKAA